MNDDSEEPLKLVPIAYAACFTAAEFARIKAGLVPAMMEDKWAIRFTEPSLFLHRSWTGRLIYRVDFEHEEEGVTISQAFCDEEVLASSDAGYQARLLGFLIDNLLLGRGVAFPIPEKVEEHVPGLFQHMVSGTAYPPEVIRRTAEQTTGSAWDAARGMIGFVASLTGVQQSVGEEAGFGQSLLDDLRFLIRFLRCRRMRVEWLPPSPAERLADEAHPIISRFGDDTVAVAHVEGRRWLVRERDWYGWPDPPRYVLFILDRERIWVAKDFQVWPTNWQQLHPDASSSRGAEDGRGEGRS